ncbi:hypothetical protein RIVM261_076060 [Rivularia sp. IAM M-261]|nr:hypothetical protein RIVM261_076060 [Rivularia sp. IAM M-261]
MKNNDASKANNLSPNSQKDMLNFSDYKYIAKEYYELASLLEISDYAAERMIQILEAAQTDGNLNFIINEIDYIIAQKNNLLNQEDCLIDKIYLDESGNISLVIKTNKEVNNEESNKPITALISSQNRQINNIEVGVYECEIHLKFRLIEEKNLFSDRDQLLQALIKAIVDNSDDSIETLQTAVKAYEVSELKASPQMRKYLMRLRNASKHIYTLRNDYANHKAQ